MTELTIIRIIDYLMIIFLTLGILTLTIALIYLIHELWVIL